MRIVQTLAEPNIITALRTSFRAMKGMMADKAMTHHKEQVSIVLRQLREGVKGYTINGHEDQHRETRMLVEFYPVGVVIIRHDSLNYSHTLYPPFILPIQSLKNR
jgi:hypothetical protein